MVESIETINLHAIMIRGNRHRVLVFGNKNICTACTCLLEQQVDTKLSYI